MSPRLPDDLISAYADGETSPEETLAVERLLAESAEARQQLGEIRSISAMLKTLPAQRVPGNFSQSVLQQAERDALLGPATTGVSPVSRRRSFWITAVSCVSTVAVVMGYALIMRQQAPNAEVMPENVAASVAESEDRTLADATPVMTLSEIDRAESKEPSWADTVHPSLTAPGESAPELGSVAVRESWEAPVNRLMYRNYDGLRTAEVGDVVEALRTINSDEVVVVQLTVIDRIDSYHSLQLLLQDNNIATETPSEANKSLTSDSNYNVYVESDVDQISTVFTELQRDKQIAEIEVTNSLPVVELNSDFAGNGYAVVSAPAVFSDNLPAAGQPPMTNSISRAIDRKQSLELQVESLQTPRQMDKAKPGEEIAEKKEQPKFSTSRNGNEEPLPTKANSLGLPRTAPARAEEPSSKDSGNPTSGTARYASGRSRVLRVDEERQQQIVDPEYPPNRRSNQSYNLPFAKLSDVERPAPPSLPEASDGELAEAAGKPIDQADEVSLEQLYGNRSTETLKRNVQVLFVLIPQEAPTPAAPAPESPGKPDGAS